MSSPPTTTVPLAKDSNGQDLTVYYDGGCPLCRAEIGVYQNCAGADRLAFVDVSNTAAELPAGLAPAAALARFHVRGADGTISSGAAGFAQLWLTLPGWRWLGRIVLLPGIRQAAELAYRGFLYARPALQWVWRRRAARRMRAR